MCTVVAFRLYDTDNNGVLTYDNINHIIRASLVENDLKLGEEQIEQVVKNVFDKMDTNQDNTITYEEFKTAMLGTTKTCSNTYQLLTCINRIFE